MSGIWYAGIVLALIIAFFASFIGVSVSLSLFPSHRRRSWCSRAEMNGQRSPRAATCARAILVSSLCPCDGLVLQQQEVFMSLSKADSRATYFGTASNM